MLLRENFLLRLKSFCPTHAVDLKKKIFKKKLSRAVDVMMAQAKTINI